MKSLFLFFALLSCLVLPAFGGEIVSIDNQGVAKFELPNDFKYERTGSFISIEPNEKFEYREASLFVHYNSALAEIYEEIEDAPSFFRRTTPEAKVWTAGESLFIIETAKNIRPDGTPLTVHKISVIADGLLFALTYQVVKGHEAGEMSLALKKSLAPIIASLGRLEI